MEEIPPVAYAEAAESLVPPVDVKVLGSLRELQLEGDLDLIAELVDIYLADAPTYIAAMHQSIMTGDAVALRQAAHTLRGSSGSLGASYLAALCGEIEEIGQAGTVAGAAGKLADAERELIRVRGALERPAC